MSEPTLIIDCDECVMRRTEACADCVVTFLCEPPGDRALVVPAEELRAVRMLREAGLAPPLHHQRAG